MSAAKAPATAKDREREKLYSRHKGLRDRLESVMHAPWYASAADYRLWAKAKDSVMDEVIGVAELLCAHGFALNDVPLDVAVGDVLRALGGGGM